MDVVRNLSLSPRAKILSKPGFWLILGVLVLITPPHYEEALQHPAFITQLTANLGLQRHAFERIVYLVPIVWAGLLFGWRGTFITSLGALACMLPRVIFISPYPMDALFETAAVFIVGNLLAISFVSLRKEREYRTRLEVSEGRYRHLFENALDAIWLHDLNGNIVVANRAMEELTGYSVQELIRMNVRDLLPSESFGLVHQIREKLLANERFEQPYDLQMIRKDKNEVCVQLVTSLVFEKSAPIALQHIARDVTEQKRLHQNQRFYLEQATRSQEEERKRISRELHDDTIQSLVVHSRKLDTLISSGEGLSEKNRLRLDELREESDNIMKGLRRLCQDLRPAALDRLGLLSALEWLASNVTEYSGVAIRVNTFGTKRRLSEEAELLLFRIVQEALRNVWRHSKATQAEVIVEFEEKKTKITVSDNGKGFSAPKTISDLAREGKLGLTGMRERAQLIGGTLTVHSQPGKGTSITVEVSV